MSVTEIEPQLKDIAENGTPRPRVSRRQVEELTLQYGKKIFHAIRKESRGISLGKVEDHLLKLMMMDEDLRFRMLHFVDVFPALRSPQQISKHLEEYLESHHFGAGNKKGPFGSTAKLVGKDRASSRALIAWASRYGIQRMAKNFIAGDTPETVAPKIRKMEDEGLHFSLDLLGEFVVSEAQAEAFCDRYLEMIQRFGTLLGSPPSGLHKEAGPRVNISIKLTSLTSHFEPMDPEGTSKAVRKRLRPLFRAAKKRGVFLNIDMEKYDYRDLTLQIILDLLAEEEFRDFENIGTVAQAYLRDAEPVLLNFLNALEKRGQGITIRLVKGAYWDSEQIWARQKGWPIPVYLKKWESDACFERCSRILLERSDFVRTAIASHNVRSLAHALALKKALKVPADRFEIQMLYGMAGPIRLVLRKMGLPVRIYTPCGELIPGMSYLVRRILENTSNESFLRQRFVEGVNEEKLLKDPKV